MSNRKITRRSLLKAALRTGIIGSSATALGLGYSVYGEPNWLDVTRLTLPLRRLPAGTKPITIAQMSDLHLSESISAAHIAEAVALTNAQQADMIVLTGDYVSHGTRYIRQVASLLGELRAPLGVFAILGNHDHWSGPELLHSTFADQGIVMLRNEQRRIDLSGGSLWLVGVDDVAEEHDDLAYALRGVPENEARLLLAHEPDFADTAAKHAIDLQLSGHSHGGQVRVPGLGALILPPLSERYPIGLRRVPGSETLIYTNRGIGMVDPPVRFNCRPEITVLTLQSG